MAAIGTTTGNADPALDQRLNDELSSFNTAATPGVAPAEELTVRWESVSTAGSDDVHLRKEL